MPRAIICASSRTEVPTAQAALQMMIQSVAGLAAKAVNQGRGDELVWADNANANLDEWFARFLAAHPDLSGSGTLGAWPLVERFTARGIVKGYILYRADLSNGDLNTYRREMDCSVNVATSLAGVLDGILVEEELEDEAKERGLNILLDARNKTQSWCFQTYQKQFNRRIVCTQDPRKPHVRDLAIAQKAFTLFSGDNELMTSVLDWLEPLSPVLGWNGGDEFLTTDLSTRYAHIQTATDWCMNLPVLMAGTERWTPPAVQRFDPAKINWNDRRSAVSFVLTDGDNVQWLQGNFFQANKSYWSDPKRGQIPFGWSCCFAHLAQLCPQAIDYASATRTAKDSWIEWGGGYYYPDHFGSARSNRWDLLAAQAQRTWALMKQTGTSIIGFNVAQFDSIETRQACEAFARQTDGLLAIFAFQYAPYEGGAGKVFWVKDGNGTEVPVVSARYSIWEHANHRPRAGTPAKVAREIRDTLESSRNVDSPRYDWVIAHAWSYFKNAAGSDEAAENLPQDGAEAAGGQRGYSPVLWCAERLPKTVHVVSPEELAWRIRMQHNPAQTRRFMAQFND